MHSPKYFFSAQYNLALEQIEDFIFSTTASPELVGKFLDEHDQALEFVGSNPNAPAIHPVTGDQSWPFSEGRYRFFFRAKVVGEELQIFLADIIDNRQANLSVYPKNSIPTYQEE